MLRQCDDAGVGVVGQPAAAGDPAGLVGAEGLAAGVQHDLRPGGADHGADGGQRDVGPVAGAQLGLLGVVEDRDTGPDLGQHARVGQRGGRGGAAAAQRGGQPDPVQGLDGRGQGTGLVGRGRVGPAGAVAVAREGEDPGHRQPGPGSGGGDLPGPLRPHTAAVLSAVHLDDDLGTGPAQRGGEQFGRLRGVHADPQGHPAGQLAQAGGPAAVRPDRVGQEQVGDPGGGEHLGLADRGHGEPDGPVVDLPAGDLDALVGLRVRAQRQSAFPGRTGGAGQVAVEHVQRDGEVRGVRGIDDHAHHRRGRA
jgi:hypothetical protein